METSPKLHWSGIRRRNGREGAAYRVEENVHDRAEGEKHQVDGMQKKNGKEQDESDITSGRPMFHLGTKMTKRVRERDRQTDRPTDREKDRQTDRERDRDRDRETGREERETDRQIDRDRDRDIDRDRETERDRQIDRERKALANPL